MQTNSPVDVLIIGAHPDDIECGAAGIALVLKKRSIPFAIVDLTKGEMGSRGTTEQRLEEAQKSAKFLGACSRETLDLGDTTLTDSVESRQLIARVVRKYRPQLVLAPYWEDLHNDHAAAGLIVRHSKIYCSLSKLADSNPPHRPQQFLYYLLHNFYSPTFVVDISDVFTDKIRAIQCYQSQFSKTAAEYGVVPVGIGDYLFHIESRSRYFGSLINVRFGEPLIADQPIKIDLPTQFLPR
jgi:bacillithiol biosynthesis deacetylase BshB1